MPKSQSKEDLIGSKEQLRGDRKSFVLPPDYVLSPTEKKFLLLAERGDCASVQRYVNKYTRRYFGTGRYFPDGKSP